MPPLAIDLFCGLGGWTEGLLAEGYTVVGKGARFTSRDSGIEGIKQGGDWFNASQPSTSRLYGSKSPQRKMASAMIAKIPGPLSRHIAAHFKPRAQGQAEAS